MAEFCKLAPTVTVREGKKTEEKPSKLFASIKKATDNYETSWNVWAYTKTPEFQEEYGDKVEYDELGEVTFPSLIKVLGLQDLYDEQKDIEDVLRDYNFNNRAFDTAAQAVESINDFNSKERKYVAVTQKVGNQYTVEVFYRNGVTTERARKQSYNFALTNEIIDLMHRMGFNVEWVSDPKYAGLFDPENATLQNGLLNIIKLKEGAEGEKALPEEFGHMVIDGLINHQLVQRLLSSLDEDTVREVLGEQYEDYAKLYNENEGRLRKEAAGKLLAQHITERGTIKKEIVNSKKSLLSRIWSWAKGLFSRITDKHIEDARERAHKAVADIYDLIASEEAIPLIDKHSVLNAEKLYSIGLKFKTLEKAAERGEKLVSKLHNVYLTKEGADRAKFQESLENIMTANASESAGEMGDTNPVASLNAFLGATATYLGDLATQVNEAETLIKQNDVTTIQQWNKISDTVNSIERALPQFEDLLNFVYYLKDLEEDDLKGLGFSLEERAQLKDVVATSFDFATIATLRDTAKTLGDFAKNSKLNILTGVFQPRFKDRRKGIGSDRDRVMTLTEILDHASRDINVIDRWFSAMSDSDDALLVLFDGLVKEQQYKRDLEMQEVYTQIAYADRDLRKAGYTSKFMLELGEDGVPTGRLLSPYDFDIYNKELHEKVVALREGGFEGRDLVKEINIWKGGLDPKTQKHRLIRVYIDPEMDALYKQKGSVYMSDHHPDAIWEDMPNPEVYNKKAHVIENLPEAQRKYYNQMMQIKRTMMTKIPHTGQHLYKAIYISKDFVEGVLDNSTGNPIKAGLDNFKKQFTRRPDDIGFGTGDNYKTDIQQIIEGTKEEQKAAEDITNYLRDALDTDIVALVDKRRIRRIIRNNKEDLKRATIEVLEYISSCNLAVVDTDFADHRVQRLPIYYTRPFKNKKMISEDFSGALNAYCGMALNYEKMNEVVNILEVGRSYVKERQVIEGEGTMTSKYSALHKTYKGWVAKAGADAGISGRMDDWMASAVYEERKNPGTAISIGNETIDTAKTLDTIKNYTGLLRLGFNVFCAVSNVLVGKLQMFIEGAAGEYCNLKDYAKALVQYDTNMLAALAEINSPVKKNKLNLLIQMFDPMGEYYENMRNVNFNKSSVARILGNGVLAHIGMNAGEHLLHCQTMLAILNHVKLTNKKTGKKVSLYDALEVKEVNGITKLVFQDDLYYERELIDRTGTANTNPNYGRPLRDEKTKELIREKVYLKDISDNNTQKFIIMQKRKIRKVNDSLNGAFNVVDRGAIHRTVLGRLVMQFRQWMPAHYMRRFARAHYDEDLEQWREGYWTTVGKIAKELSKDIIKAKWKYASTYYNQMNEHEKRNLNRALTETAIFVSLFALCKTGGKVGDYDRDWWNKMCLYQVHRMYLEVGASIPWATNFIPNILQMLQSPAPTMSFFDSINKVLHIERMFNEIQTGRYQGWTQWERDAFGLLPLFPQLYKAIDFDDSMFSMYETDN